MLKGTGEKIAISYKDMHITYNKLYANIDYVSSIFNDLKNTRIAIYSENSIEWIYAFYAIWVNHCIAVPIDFMAGLDDVDHILRDSKPEVIFCSEGRYNDLKKILNNLSYEPRVIVLESLQNEIDNPSTPIQIDYEPQDTAVIIYTSGTTGNPKGVELSYENLLFNIEAIANKVKIYNSSDIILMLLPLHHILPLMGTLIIPMYLGGSIAVSPSLNADDIIQTLQKHKATIVIGVPRLYSLIRKGIIDKINQRSIARIIFKTAKIIQNRKLSNILFKEVHAKFGGAVRYLVCGGAPLDAEIATDFKTLGFDLLEGYGMTEAAPMISFTRPGKLIPGAAGQPVPGVEIKIKDGEILARGKNIMKGYYRNKRETDNIIRNGWLHTGDLGHIDKKGYLIITGRKKDIIVLSNGKNINPVEIEEKLVKLSPEIKEVGVILHHDKLCAVIYPDNKKLTHSGTVEIQQFFLNEVIKKYNQSIPASKQLYNVFITDEELPKTRLNKLQRFKLSEYITQPSRPKSKVKEIEFKELETLIGFLNDQLNTDVHPDDNLLNDLALDSLNRITLVVYIENTFGVKIPNDNLLVFDTVLDLGKYIQQNKKHIKPEIINWASILKEKVHFKLPNPGLSFNVFNWFYRVIFKLFFRIKAEGLINIPEGPCIIAPNHQSFLDGFVLASRIGRKKMRSTFFYAKEKYWQKSWKQFLARKNNIILVDINKDLKLSIQKLAEVLNKGKKLIIFPEGTRSSDGTLGEFKKTFAILSQELNVPVIPAVINGAHKIMPKGAAFPRLFQSVSIKFLQPVYPINHSYDSLSDKVRTVVQAQIRNNPY